MIHLVFSPDHPAWNRSEFWWEGCTFGDTKQQQLYRAFEQDETELGYRAARELHQQTRWPTMVELLIQDAVFLEFLGKLGMLR